MTSSTRTIVVGTDFSKTAELAMTRAFEAAANQPEAEIHAVCVMEGAVDKLHPDRGEMAQLGTLDEAAKRLQAHAKELMDQYIADNGRLAFKRCVVHAAQGSPAEQITQLAAELDADMIVVGTHGRKGISRLLLGSVAEGVLRLAHCPVLVVRPKDYSSSEARVPAIEPPCPRCVQARKDSDGKEMWCEQHREKHGRRHTYYSVDRSSVYPSSKPGLSSLS